MKEKIAVLANEEGHTASFFEDSEIQLYEKLEDEWKLTSSRPVKINPAHGMGELRKSIFEVIDYLGDCTVIVVREMSGVPYNIFDSRGFSIIELEGEPSRSLEGIWQMLLKEASFDKTAQIEESIPMQPVETALAGNFTIDLSKIQGINPAISSKKLLLPFLRNSTFHELEVLCSHVPPWFEVELENLGLGFDVQMLDTNLFKVLIFHKSCSEKIC